MLSKPSARACAIKFARHFERLYAINRLLHFGIEILDAQAQAVEAEPPQSFQVPRAGHSWIHFDSDLRVRLQT